jgi:hypothetical protein
MRLWVLFDSYNKQLLFPKAQYPVGLSEGDAVFVTSEFKF